MNEATRDRRPVRGQRLGVIVTAVVVAGCGLCGDEDVVDVPSPDARYVARSFVRSCGATTGYVTHVELRRNRFWLAGAQSIYVANGRYDLAIAWDGPAELRIMCARCPPRHPDAATWNGVTIRLGNGQGTDEGSSVSTGDDEPQNNQYLDSSVKRKVKSGHGTSRRGRRRD